MLKKESFKKIKILRANFNLYLKLLVKKAHIINIYKEIIQNIALL